MSLLEQLAAVTAERDAARETAVRFECEVARLQNLLEQHNTGLIQMAKDLAAGKPGPRASR